MGDNTLDLAAVLAEMGNQEQRIVIIFKMENRNRRLDPFIFGQQDMPEVNEWPFINEKDRLVIVVIVRVLVMTDKGTVSGEGFSKRFDPETPRNI